MLLAMSKATSRATTDGASPADLHFSKMMRADTLSILTDKLTLLPFQSGAQSRNATKTPRASTAC